MNRKVLIVTSVASMIDQFIIPSIKLLQTMGYDVDVATNFEKGSTCTSERIEELKKKLNEMSVDAFQIDFDRKITNIKGVVKAIKQLDEVLKGNKSTISGERKHIQGEYAFVHCHSPIGGVVGRLVAKKNSIKSIYTAHGFHFYKEAPFKNWILFYPVEWFLSWITDVLITINKEDYERSKRSLHAKKLYYVPGIGIDIKKFKSSNTNYGNKKSDLSLTDKNFIIFSVGELNDNKNHSIIIKALGELASEKPDIYKNVHYIIAGRGDLSENLQNLAKEKGIKNQLHLLGFRTDVAELLQIADIFALPSKREGLNVSLMEAIVSGKYCLASNIRGNQDLIIDESIGCLVDSLDLQGWKNAIAHSVGRNRKNDNSKRNEIISMISSENIEKNMRIIYEEVTK